MFLTDNDLMRQAELLQEVSREIDPATVDLVQVTTPEDIHLFEMLNNQENRDQLLEKFLVGEIEIKAVTIEAARLLVDIILED